MPRTTKSVWIQTLDTIRPTASQHKAQARDEQASDIRNTNQIEPNAWTCTLVFDPNHNQSSNGMAPAARERSLLFLLIFVTTSISRSRFTNSLRSQASFTNRIITAKPCWFADHQAFSTMGNRRFTQAVTFGNLYECIFIYFPENSVNQLTPE